jgi:hypothetical protein
VILGAVVVASLLLPGGGVHYRFAIRTSEDVGRKVAAYMIDNTLKPVR